MGVLDHDVEDDYIDEYIDDVGGTGPHPTTYRTS
jgi:hypothetical protein